MPLAKETGRVTEMLPNLLFKVEVKGTETNPSATYVCYLAGKMKLNKIKVIVGDRVEFIPDQFGGKVTNRITKRL